MSSNTDVFRLRDEDVAKMLVSHVHLGSNNLNHQMEQYIWRRRTDGQYIINVKKTWEKLVLAARAIAAVDNPSDVAIISARPYAQRGILKFAAHTGASPIAGRFTPGAFTNQIQKAFKEPRLLIISDPRIDHQFGVNESGSEHIQAITEASYVNIPVISFCNSDSPLKLIDIGIPCNNKGQKAIGLMLWMLAREVLLIRGRINRATGFNLDDKEIMPDLYFYRDPEEEEVKEPEVLVVDAPKEDWGGEVAAQGDDMWAGNAAAPPATGQKIDFTNLASTAGEVTDWAQQVEMQNWNAQGSAPAANEWGASADGGSKW